MANANVKEFTSDNWQQEVEQSDQPVVVDFWAPWCAPCRALGPTIDKIANQFVGKVKVGKLNVDDSPELASRYGVTSIPRIFIFKGGDKPLKTFAVPPSEIELAKSIQTVVDG
jgi:thioredoxin 1